MADTKYDNRPDEVNPVYMFQTFEGSLLAEIAKGEINAQEFAAREMAARGVDKNLAWVGFERAAEIWGVK